MNILRFMKMTNRNPYKTCSLAAAMIFILLNSSVFGQSIYGSFGIGELRYFSSVRAVGMGGAGLAVRDPIAQNQLNPAAWVTVDNVSYGCGMRFEGIRFNQSSRSNTSNHATLNTISLAVKPASNLTISGGFRPHTDSDFEIYSKTPDYTRVIEGSGGISIGYFGGAYSVNDKVALGINYLYYFGADFESWLINFKDDDFVDTASNLLRHKKGQGISIGVTVMALPRLHLGGVFFSEAELKTEKKIKTAAQSQQDIKGPDIKVPYSFGIGFSSEVAPRITFAGDVFRWQYKNIAYKGASGQNYNNSTRYSAGIEVSPSEMEEVGLFRKLSYRFGGYFWNLYSPDIDGSSVTEKFLTAGMSILFNEKKTRIDVGFEGGIRASKSKAVGSEKIARLYIALVGVEKWFVRR